MTKHPLKILLLLALLSACSSGTKNGENNRRQITISATKDSSVSDLMEYRFISLETSEECLIGHMADVQMHANRIFVLDSHKSSALFVFDQNGRFLTKVGTKGNGPGEYNHPQSFVIDLRTRSIVINDNNKKQLLYYDLDNYKHKYTKELPGYFQDMSILKNGKIALYSSAAIDQGDRSMNCLQICDSLLNPETTCFDVGFKSDYSFTLGGRNIYHVGERSFVFHNQIPTVYEIVDGGVKPYMDISFDSFSYPTIDYLKKESQGNKDYFLSLFQSGFISSYSIYESQELICTMFSRDMRQLYYGIYNKNNHKSYLYTREEFVRLFGSGLYVFFHSATEDLIIASVNPSFMGKPFSPHADLQAILNGFSPDDNPILCLMKSAGSNWPEQ